jgi:hypothetical protein
MLVVTILLNKNSIITSKNMKNHLFNFHGYEMLTEMSLSMLVYQVQVTQNFSAQVSSDILKVTI